MRLLDTLTPKVPDSATLRNATLRAKRVKVARGRTRAPTSNDVPLSAMVLRGASTDSLRSDMQTPEPSEVMPAFGDDSGFFPDDSLTASAALMSSDPLTNSSVARALSFDGVADGALDNPSPSDLFGSSSPQLQCSEADELRADDARIAGGVGYGGHDLLSGGMDDDVAFDFDV